MRLSVSRLALAATLGGAVITLSACSALDIFGDSEEVPAAAIGSPFTQGLVTAYTDLANQADALPSDEDSGFFSSITGLFDFSEKPKDMLKSAFTAKADIAASGAEPQIEAAPNPAVAPVHDRLVTALAAGKDRFPEEAARAQSDYDCWVLFGMVPAAAANAANCKNQLDASLPRLETVVRPAPPPIPAPPPVTVPAPAPVTTAPVSPAPVASAPAPVPATTDFTVYFEFNSWTLTAEDLTVLTNVINTARAGGQAHITVVGHTDTSGSSEYNQALSVRRANVAVEALVDMGARRAAIQASGVGETDLAVQTGDNVKEAKNRRTVIDLLP